MLNKSGLLLFCMKSSHKEPPRRVSHLGT